MVKLHENFLDEYQQSYPEFPILVLACLLTFRTAGSRETFGKGNDFYFLLKIQWKKEGISTEKDI